MKCLVLLSLLFETIVASDGEFCFPSDFLFGSATAAYQVEGGWNETGREPSIWDAYCREHEQVECANVADDMLHRYRSDIQLMRQMGLDTFRFSISWSRVMKWNETSKQMEKNQPGLKFYHHLIQNLRENKIEPIVTMYHWDLPLKLHTELNGWLNPNITSHFLQYASLLYQEYGHHVKYWATFNEPWSFVTGGYGYGNHAPGLSNSTENVYHVAHHVLLSHAKAVQAFRQAREEGTVRRDGQISIVLNCDYAYPLDPTDPSDIAAANRTLEYTLGWFLKPIVYGDYPSVMKQRTGSRLPKFTPEESQALKHSYDDVLMLNHYSSKVVTSCDSTQSKKSCDLTPGWDTDLGIDDSRFPNEARLSSTTNGERNCKWFSGYPKGYYQVIKWTHLHDVQAKILLTENGWCGNATIENMDQLWYYHTYLHQVVKAIHDGIPIIGYTAWSFLDNYEWGSFNPRFGLFYVDYPSQTGSKDGYSPKDEDLTRIPRPAAHLIAQVAQTKCLPSLSTSYRLFSTRKQSHYGMFWIAIGLGIAMALYIERRRFLNVYTHLRNRFSNRQYSSLPTE